MSLNILKNRDQQKGISLLEVLAALVILSMGASVAFSWFNQSVSTLNRLNIQEKNLLLKIEAIEFIRSINPSKEPEGSINLQNHTLKWSSHSISNRVRTLTKRGGNGQYETEIFKVSVDISNNKDDTKITFFDVELTGYILIPGSTGKGISW